ncbi:MAG: D-alanyl-D-alanine carboxypeptidase family protein [Christensenellales bacterium]|jgi:D-alanyl-D-alanine carboxypeptidase (penicillin-binding protein 5/6)
MKKIIVLLVLLIIFVFPNAAFAEGEASQAKSYILIDAGSGNVLKEQNADEQRDCASLVKVMSLLLFFESEQNGRVSLTDTVTISQHAASMGGTQVFLDVNTTHTIGDLLKAVIVCSANDAAAALAEKIAGSEEAFVEMMNKKANVLGIGAKFVNSTGLSAEGQTMSARDVATVCRELVKYDQLYNWSRIWMDNYVHPDGRETEMVNTNRLVKYYDGCDGICTGSSPTAGYCLAATVSRSGGRFIYVSLGSPNSSARFDEAGNAFDYAYAGFTAKTIVREGQQLAENLEVIGGTKSYVSVYAGKSFSALIEKGKENFLEKELVLLENVTAPLEEGAVIGYLRIIFDGKEIGRVDAVVKQKIEVLNFSNSLKRILTWWLFA